MGRPPSWSGCWLDVDDAVGLTWAACERIDAEGLVPVLAHPERCLAVAADPASAVRFAARGWPLCLNGPSVLGDHGRTAERIAWWFLGEGTVSLIASDGGRAAAGARRRPRGDRATTRRRRSRPVVRRPRPATRVRLAREGRTSNGAGRVPVGEPEPPELIVWHEFLDQRKEQTLLKPDVCVKQRSRRIQRLSIDDAGRHRDVECASEPLELYVLDACLAEEGRLRRDVPEEKREELFFLISKVDTLFVPEELPELPGRGKSSGSISVRGSTAQAHGLHESIVMVARERDQGGVALHSTTLWCSVGRAMLGKLTRRRHDGSAPSSTVSLSRPRGSEGALGVRGPLSQRLGK